MPMGVDNQFDIAPEALYEMSQSPMLFSMDCIIITKY